MGGEKHNTGWLKIRHARPSSISYIWNCDPDRKHDFSKLSLPQRGSAEAPDQATYIPSLNTLS